MAYYLRLFSTLRATDSLLLFDCILGRDFLPRGVLRSYLGQRNLSFQGACCSSPRVLALIVPQIGVWVFFDLVYPHHDDRNFPSLFTQQLETLATVVTADQVASVVPWLHPRRRYRFLPWVPRSARSMTPELLLSLPPKVREEISRAFLVVPSTPWRRTTPFCHSHLLCLTTHPSSVGMEAYYLHLLSNLQGPGPPLLSKCRVSPDFVSRELPTPDPRIPDTVYLLLPDGTFFSPVIVGTVQCARFENWVSSAVMLNPDKKILLFARARLVHTPQAFTITSTLIFRRRLRWHCFDLVSYPGFRSHRPLLQLSSTATSPDTANVAKTLISVPVLATRSGCSLQSKLGLF
ncbi:hypothetical protein DFH06DRAFT_1125809 [Mycena polygramma]|nr:hypothetical protein DFH06DRAFT_1125809 [Mycena polygramma]